MYNSSLTYLSSYVLSSQVEVEALVEESKDYFAHPEAAMLTAFIVSGPFLTENFILGTVQF